VGVVLGVSLLVVGETLLACQPPPEDARQRRLQLQEEVASLAKALDVLDGRLSKDCQRMSAWEEGLATSMRSQKRGAGGRGQLLGRSGPTAAVRLAGGPGAKADFLASRP
jgi:hypothetical protein